MKLLLLASIFAVQGSCARPGPGLVYYIKDQRTGLCFAHYAHGTGLALVPCERIPTEILIDQ